MDNKEVRPGMRVVTSVWLQSEFPNKKANAFGTVVQYAPRSCGEGWFIRHDDGTIAGYYFTEFEPAENITRLQLNYDGNQFPTHSNICETLADEIDTYKSSNTDSRIEYFATTHYARMTSIEVWSE